MTGRRRWHSSSRVVVVAPPFIGAVIFVSACGGAEPSVPAASGSPEAAMSPGAGPIAPLGTGFILVSARSQLHLDEPSYLEQSDCMLRVSSLQDAKEFAGLAPPISLDSRLAKTAGPERKGRDGPEAEGEQGDRRS